MPSAATDVVTRRARLFIGGRWVDGVGDVQVFDKFTGNVIGQAAVASREQVDDAIAGAHRSFETVRLDPHRRFQILSRAAVLLEARRDELVETIVAEGGMPVSNATLEVTRAVETLVISAEEGKRLVGEVVPIEAAPGHAHRLAFTIRVPRGVVCGITSFNSPLNMVAHKVAPALASGNTVVIKPPQATPFSAAILVDILVEAGLPPTHIALVQGPGSKLGTWLVENKLIRFYTFTGSTEVGKALQRSVGLRPITLELGSIASTIVCGDADLERAAPRVANSAFRRAGQACTSTQRLFVERSVLDRFLELFLEAVRRMPIGDPHHPDTAVGPMISEAEARRAESWIQEAVAGGARVLAGGTRRGTLLEPTVLADTKPGMRVVSEEVFAPVVTVLPFETIDDAIRQVNATNFGLAAGIFTRDIDRALGAAKALHVGVVHINEPPTSRADLMPFAGVKDSGLGTEGPKYAMHDMTEARLVTVSLS